MEASALLVSRFTAGPCDLFFVAAFPDRFLLGVLAAVVSNEERDEFGKSETA